MAEPTTTLLWADDGEGAVRRGPTRQSNHSSAGSDLGTTRDQHSHPPHCPVLHPGRAVKSSWARPPVDREIGSSAKRPTHLPDTTSTMTLSSALSFTTACVFPGKLARIRSYFAIRANHHSAYSFPGNDHQNADSMGEKQCSGRSAARAGRLLVTAGLRWAG